MPKHCWSPTVDRTHPGVVHAARVDTATLSTPKLAGPVGRSIGLGPGRHRGRQNLGSLWRCAGRIAGRSHARPQDSVRRAPEGHEPRSRKSSGRAAQHTESRAAGRKSHRGHLQFNQAAPIAQSPSGAADDPRIPVADVVLSRSRGNVCPTVHGDCGRMARAPAQQARHPDAIGAGTLKGLAAGA